MSAQQNPELYIDVKFNEQQYENAFKKINLKLQQQAITHEQKITQIVAQGNAKRDVQNEAFIQKQIQNDLRHKQKLEQMMETHQQKLLIRQKEFEEKSKRSQQSWSAKMTEGLESIVNSIKGFVIAYAGMKGIESIRNAFNMADELYETADAFDINVNKLIAIKKSWTDAGASFEQVDKILSKIQFTLQSAQTGDKNSIKELASVGATAGDNLEIVINKLMNANNITDFFDKKMYLAWTKIQKGAEDYNKTLDTLTKSGAVLSDNTGQGLQKINDRLAQLKLQWEIFIVNTLGNEDVTKTIQLIITQLETVFNIFIKNKEVMDSIVIWLKLVATNLTFTYTALRLVIEGFSALFGSLADLAQGNYMAAFVGLKQYLTTLDDKVGETANNITKIWSSTDGTLSSTINELKSQRLQLENLFMGSLNSDSNGNSSNEQKENYLKKLADEIKAQKDLRKETESYIAILEKYRTEYKDNYDILQLVNKELEKQKEIINDLNRNNKILEINDIGTLGINIDAKGFETSFSSTIKEALKNFKMEPVKYSPIMIAESTKKQLQFELEQILNAIEEYKRKLNTGALDTSEKAFYTHLLEQAEQEKDELNYKLYGDNKGQNLFNQLSEQIRNFSQTYAPIINYTSNLINEVINSSTSFYQNQLDILQEIINVENERWSNQSQRLIDAGLENTAYYKKQKDEHDKFIKQQSDKETSLKSKLWDAERQGKITSVIMNTAQGIMAAWASGPIIGAIMSALIASTGAIQLGTVLSQKNPYRRNLGGWIGGNGYGDYQPALLTSGEYVVNRDSAKRNAQLLETINSGKEIPVQKSDVYVTIQGNVIGNNDWVENDLIPAINKAVNKGHYVASNR